jgi:hypothetical protein
VTVNGIAQWQAPNWSALGSGLDLAGAGALAVHGNSLFVGGGFNTAGGKVSHHIAVWQPRVNVTDTVMGSSPEATVIGEDPYGFHRPAMMADHGTVISYGGGLPTSVTLDRAREIHVDGQRVNGAFTLSPEGMQFGGEGATLRIEFSEDDVAAYPGVAYSDFEAVRLTYPPDYPENKEAAGQQVLAGQSPAVPIRIDNGKQIYAITAPITEISSTYGAVPGATSAVEDWSAY